MSSTTKPAGSGVARLEKPIVLDFKSVSPFFEWERDGVRPFTERLYDAHDPRFRAISRWWPWLRNSKPIAIRITNPATGEKFMRELIGKARQHDADVNDTIKAMPPAERRKFMGQLYKWVFLFLGEKVEPVLGAGA